MNFYNLSYIKIEDDADDNQTILLNNGEDTIEVPKIIKNLIPKFDGTHSNTEIRKDFFDEYQIDLDVNDFIDQLNQSGFLQDKNRQLKQKNILIGRVYNKIFLTKCFFALEGILLLISSFLVLKDIHLYFGFNYLFISKHLTVSVFIYVVLSWTLVLEHELCHYYSSIGFKVPATITLGSRLQFLVAQTTILNPYSLTKKQRIKVYLTGILTDLFICELCVIIISVNSDNLTNNILRCVLYLKTTAIIWQFLIYMKTDVYYILTTILNEKNLMHESQLFLKNKNRNSRKLVRNYAYLLFFGRGISVMYFIAFQLPLILLGIQKIYIDGITVDSIISGTLLMSSWLILIYVLIKKAIKYIISKRNK